MTLENTEKLIDDIVIKRKAYLASKIKRYPSNNFRASNIGECDRSMVYDILDWDKKTMHDEGLQAIFDRGNDEERLVVRDLTELGFKFIHQQTPIEIKNREGDVICRGAIDGKMIYEKEAIPSEIKSTNMNTFNTIRSIDDLRKKPLHRRYLRQLQLYLYGNNAESGLFIFSNLQGSYKLIPVMLDLGECEKILQRLERNWEFVKKKEYPDRIDYNEQICGRCPFKHLCLPEVKHDGAQFIDNAELEAALERREELKPIVEEYDAIDEQVKSTFREIPQAFVGKSWQIDGKWRVMRRIDTKAIPDDIRAQYETETKTWMTKIIHL